MAFLRVPSYQGEVEGWPKTSWNVGKFTGVRKLICDYADRTNLLEDLDDRSPTGEAYWPTEYADGPPNAIAYKADIEPMPGKHTNAPGVFTPAYDKVVIVAYYTTFYTDYSATGPFVQEWIEPTGEFMPVDGDKLQWGSGNGTALGPTEGPGKLIPGYDFISMYRNVGTTPGAWISSTKIGHVNSNWVNTNLDINFAPGYLLWQPPTFELASGWGRNATWHIKRRLSFRPFKWNQHWRTETAAFEDLYLSGTSTKYLSYPEASF